ncbi:anthranilate phosphoribosyltransferase [Saccharobesus litoralis]|uniref:Anthranilate phosphoribosyltransferase n=1 Tax=Saccharobesus litoralis TaxID=2172099 RepID=A0A2S0VU16_9ALTE|nr:anthranilate phosphoribosyltransferase [Saccharobesus litoralis]AWB67714.1 anthranilate phosphoribosyltransferase [Saccharobesus litoralis]
MAFIDNALAGIDSSKEQSFEFFNQVILGNIDPIVLSAVLGALKVKSEQPDEIAGAAQAMRQNALVFDAPTDKIIADSCGTGGDGANTINISTTTAIVAAACGLTMTKHGNRSVSSQSGSADLLESFGVNLTPSPDQARICLDKANICFFFAPQYHAGIKHAMPVRKTLKTRTIFNILGPLTNPAAPQVQLMGVYSPELLKPICETLKLLGLQSAMVVHGSGLDEIALHGNTQVAELKNGQIKEYTLTPSDFGVEQSTLEAIKGGTPEENAEITKAILAGEGQQAHVNAVAINVAALLVLAGLAQTLPEGVQQAKAVMKNGKALETLALFVEYSNG